MTDKTKSSEKEKIKLQLRFEQLYLEDLKQMKRNEENLSNGRRKWFNQEIENVKNKIQKLDETLEEVKN